MGMSSTSNPVRTEAQVSAGGCVLRDSVDGFEIVLISVGSPPRWQLPKGIIDKGETPEVAAIREVREEAGINATVEQLVAKVEYWYQASHSGERIRYHKYVYFFLMRFESGDTSDHDHEVTEARWFPAESAAATLAFKSEKTIVDKALLLARGG